MRLRAENGPHIAVDISSSNSSRRSPTRYNRWDIQRLSPSSNCSILTTPAPSSCRKVRIGGDTKRASRNRQLQSRTGFSRVGQAPIGRVQSKCIQPEPQSGISSRARSCGKRRLWVAVADHGNFSPPISAGLIAIVSTIRAQRAADLRQRRPTMRPRHHNGAVRGDGADRLEPCIRRSPFG